MRIDWSTLALQTFNALVLVWLLARFMFRPIAEIVTKRQDAARKVLQDAQAIRVAAEAERKAAMQEAECLARGRSEALRQVQVEVEAERAALLASARAEVDTLRQTATAELEASRAARARSIGLRATRLAIDIAEKLLDRLPESARVDGFIDGLVDGIGHLPDEARAELGAGAGALRLTVARALSEREEQACRATLAASLARPVTLDVHIDPSLIAGLELDGSYLHVRNSFRHDIEQIEATLTNDDGADA
ncbi:ATP synthase F0 subcomplex B subunit [Trinickia symbiotica]|uniref:ATP synthase subunit b n=1 Tax=Trinickia symbiotica TaxID=863227 RepID=A0A2N7X4I2_9BURK|nr:F0F1 ATP synthase subunit delta [Trinickia symbiotica]PMS36669.1 F0F1 ATP synthase subunit B [Trinickia symbiotica]PPK46102.1 ATP synthase F0 subcomplex B subunit [Trinickia symbiotica]